MLVVGLAPTLVAADALGTFCGDTVYAANSTFNANLQRLAATLPRSASSSGTLFATAKVGTLPYIVHGLLQCRADVSAAACESCATGAFEDAQQLCAYNKDATVFWDMCVLRYSDQEFLLSSDFSSFDDDRMRLLTKRRGSDTSASFDIAAAFLINATLNKATESPMRFATGVLLQHSGGQEIFSLVRCTPDLAPSDCRKCMSYVVDFGVANNFCRGARGCIVSLVRCGFIYDQSSFFSNDQHNKGKICLMLAITLTIVGAALLFTGLLLYCFVIKTETAERTQGNVVVANTSDQGNVAVANTCDQAILGCKCGGHGARSSS